MRLNRVFLLSSKMNIAVRSPRSAALAANSAAMVDLPVPAAPCTSVLVPRSRPPPISESSPAMLLRRRSRLELWRCSAATRRGNTRRPPRSIT